jgi:hypothetical protein
MKIRPVGLEVFLADGRTGKQTKIIVSFANTPKDYQVIVTESLAQTETDSVVATLIICRQD